MQITYYKALSLDPCGFKRSCAKHLKTLSKPFCRGRSEPLIVLVYNTMNTHTVCHAEIPKTKDFEVIDKNVSQLAKSLYFLHETKLNVYAFILVSCPLC